MVALAAGNVNGADTVVLQLKWYHQFQFAGYYAASQQGFYQDAGLAVEIREGDPRTDAVDEVLSGRADYGVANSDVLLRRLRGDPVVALAAIFQHSPLVLIAVESTGIAHPQDMIGRRIGISRSTRDAELLAMLQNEGVPLEEIHPPDGGRFSLSMYYDGSADAASAYLTNEPFYLEEKQIPYRVIQPLTYGIDFYGDCLFTSEKELAAHPERVGRFHEASLKGWEYAMAHPEEMVDLIIDRYGSRKPRAHLLYEAEKMKGLILPRLVELGHMNPGRWRHIADTFVDLKMASPGYDLDGFIYDPDPRPDLSRIRRLIALLLVILLVAGCGVAVLYRFNRRLRNEVSEREKAEKTLRFQAELMDQIQDAIVATDITGRIVYVNEAVIRSTEKSRETLIGSTVNAFDLAGEPDMAQKLIHRTLTNGSWCGRVVNRLADGARCIFESRAWVVRDPDGNPSGIVGISTDITEREQMAEDLRAAKDAADAANQAKSRFLATMSHEIRTPMNAILGFSDILKGRTRDAKTRTYLNHIHSSGKALLALIDEILDFSKIEAGKMELSPEPVIIRHLLMEIREMFIRKTRERGVDLQVIIPDTFPEVLVLDEVRLRQILINLLANAVKFTHRGSIRLCVHEHRRAGDPPSRPSDHLDIAFEVEDTGMGIPATEQQRIFDPFRQQTAHPPGQEGGTGLGLSITRSLVTLMNGDISLESGVGVGSTFRIELRGVPFFHRAAQGPVRAPEEADLDFAPATLLLVDDAPSNRSLIHGYLEDRNLRIIDAQSGEEALRLLRIGPGQSAGPPAVSRPDAILMDICMPGMDGYEATRRIKDHPLYGEVPVIALTASATKEEEERALSIFDAFIRKPVSRGQILAVLRGHLPRRPQGEDAWGPPPRAARPADAPPLAPEITDRIRRELLPRWREIKDLYFIDDVADFARKVEAVAVEHQVSDLADYGLRLRKSAERPDVEEMGRLMSRFESVAGGIVTDGPWEERTEG